MNELCFLKLIKTLIYEYFKLHCTLTHRQFQKRKKSKIEIKNENGATTWHTKASHIIRYIYIQNVYEMP